MCGIAGYVGQGSEKQLRNMLATIQHRGPDDSGVYIDDSLGLGHQRLAIIDVSAKGHQPMFLPDSSVGITFNGEIYNYKELQKSLKEDGVQFQSESDTEVLLQLYRRKGDAFLDSVRGMFALGLYDFRENILLLARDRMGEKPLYWTLQNGTLWFASELQALFQCGIKKDIDQHALNCYLQFDYVPTPLTMIQGVNKLEAGTLLVYHKGITTKKQFWTPPKQNTLISHGDALQELDGRLLDSVEKQLVSDVPIGVFLSGGLDSSTIAYYARKSGQPINTFSIAFDDPSFDESRFANSVARHLGTQHHEDVMRSDDALGLITELPTVFSEPVADASVVPTMFLSRFARKSVKVALGGDGGDELFAGYPTFQADSVWRLFALAPEFLQHVFAQVSTYLPVSHGNFSFSYNVRKFISSNTTISHRRHLEWLGTFSERERGKLGRLPDEVFSHADAYANEFTGDAGNKLLYVYLRSYLLDQVLVKVDRASMHYALETRAPFLDHKLVEYVFSLPYEMKYKRGTTKHLLKELMQDKLPGDIVFRKKKGFGIPLARWLTGPLRALCDDLLSARSLQHGFFNVDYIHDLKRDHMENVRDNRKELWNLMVFQMWYQHFI